MVDKISAEKRKKMASILKDLKKKISELEKMRKSIEPKKASAHATRTLIEEIHVPALEVLKEKRKTVH